ncbi:hypothetical protein EYF80_006569 [Liparis tanakae]|uniref:Uncharacterized protein n=1 Tax=Liparis tanakae TaxID=230148 RepID=A0A4Z2IZC1_9TELE|nr:hypothetical protein EYF80_006569 [Liparis tanakae]
MAESGLLRKKVLFCSTTRPQEVNLYYFGRNKRSPIDWSVQTGRAESGGMGEGCGSRFVIASQDALQTSGWHTAAQAAGSLVGLPVGAQRHKSPSGSSAAPDTLEDDGGASSIPKRWRAEAEQESSAAAWREHKEVGVRVQAAKLLHHLNREEEKLMTRALSVETRHPPEMWIDVEQCADSTASRQLYADTRLQHVDGNPMRERQSGSSTPSAVYGFSSMFGQRGKMTFRHTDIEQSGRKDRHQEDILD